MPKRFYIWYVTSPNGTLPSLLIVDVTEFTLTYRLKHTISPGLNPLGQDP